MLKITFEAATFDGIISEITKFAKGFDKLTISFDEDTPAPVLVITEDKKEKKSAAKKTAPVKKAPEPEDIPTPEEKAAVTKEDIVVALKKLSIDKAREIVLSFGAKKIGEILEKDYAAVLAACEALS